MTALAARWKLRAEHASHFVFSSMIGVMDNSANSGMVDVFSGLKFFHRSAVFSEEDTGASYHKTVVTFVTDDTNEFERDLEQKLEFEESILIADFGWVKGSNILCFLYNYKARALRVLESRHVTD